MTKHMPQVARFQEAKHRTHFLKKDYKCAVLFGCELAVSSAN